MLPLASRASLIELTPKSKPFPASPEHFEFTQEGKFELAKVRILGVPAINVASLVPLQESSSIGASVRARVIEGNLRALYHPDQICSWSERLSEVILNSILGGDSQVCRAGERYGLMRSDEPIKLDVIQENNGLYEISVRVAGRAASFPLLTITNADAEINGLDEKALAQLWRERLEKRLNYARRVYAPEQLQHRFRLALLMELLLGVAVAGTVLLWNRLRQRTTRLQREHLERGQNRRSIEIRLHFEQALTIGVLVLMVTELVLMLAFGVMAIPGQLPLSMKLLLQPLLAISKFILISFCAYLLRSLTTFLLRQWSADINVPLQEQNRRQQRYRSLVRISQRLINVSGVLIVGFWIILDVPGVRSTSTSLLLAGGALLGALAFVFQGLLRDFSTGLLLLLEDRCAIGDWIEVDGIQGEVIDVGLFSTQVRCLDQRVNVIDNASIVQMRNHTKLRSGSLITLLISHRQTDLDVVYRVLAAEISEFRQDPLWGSRLIADPILRGVKRTSALGVHMQILLVTRAGEQWTTEREFQRRILKALHRRGIDLADGLEISPSTLLPSGAR